MLEAAHSYELYCGVAELIACEGGIHSVDLGRIDQPLHMLAQPENGRTAAGGITANALENARPVINNVRHHVDPGVVPINELAVLPHFWRDLHRFDIFSSHNFG